MRKPLIFLGVLGSVATPLLAAINSINGPAYSYSQNFNSLASSGLAQVTWTDDSTISSWYAQAEGSFGGDYRVSTGAGWWTLPSDLYSFGSSGSSDRALGSIAGGTPGDFAYGVQFYNATSLTVGQITVAYTGEQWRRSSTGAEDLVFHYRISSTALTSLNPGSDTDWTSVPELDFTSPQNGGTNRGLDGNDAANREALSHTFTVNLAPGKYLMLRWRDIDDGGSDHGLAIDDFSVSGFTLVPEPWQPAAFAGLGMLGYLAWRRRTAIAAS